MPTHIAQALVLSHIDDFHREAEKARVTTELRKERTGKRRERILFGRRPRLAGPAPAGC